MAISGNGSAALVRHVRLDQLRATTRVSPAFINLGVTEYPRLERIVSRAASEIFDAIESIASGVRGESPSMQRVRTLFEDVRREGLPVPDGLQVMIPPEYGTAGFQQRQAYISKLVEFVRDNRMNAPALVELAKRPLPIEALNAMVSAARDFLSEGGRDAVLCQVAQQLSPMALSQERSDDYRRLYVELKNEVHYASVHDVLSQRASAAVAHRPGQVPGQISTWLDEQIADSMRSSRVQAVIHATRVSKDPAALRQAVTTFRDVLQTDSISAEKLGKALVENPATPTDVLAKIADMPSYTKQQQRDLQPLIEKAIIAAHLRNSPPGKQQEAVQALVARP